MRKLVLLLLLGYVACRIAEETGWKRTKGAGQAYEPSPLEPDA